MITVEINAVPSPEQMRFIVNGMRNPLNSWKYSDSVFGESPVSEGRRDIFVLGEKDKTLMTSLAAAGSEHRKFMRMMPIGFDILAPLYFWKEFDTYKVGTTANSCSTMHRIHSKEFTIDDFSHEHLDGETVSSLFTVDTGYASYNCSAYDFLNITCEVLNHYRELYLKTKDKKYWWQLIQLLPSSYNQKRSVMMNYETLRTIYHQRRFHKLDEWVTFCKEIEKVPYSFLIREEEEK